MPSLKRFGSAVVSAAVLTSLTVAVAPAAIADTGLPIPQPVVQESKKLTCSELTVQLSTQLQAAQTALALATPDVVAAQTAITAAQATVVQLQAQGCLPTPPSPTCAALALQLQQNLQALNAALTTFPINQTQVSLALSAVISTSAQLQANHCTTTS
ncbi:hypothetical protein [Streptomyces soliscabiei]|uniref:hypothetical protein n=1 Tax=Streptomyces soliscabiei TaxID=588897 RepID=UPI0029B9A1C9|nr:hypothetical protein [Streptomyces sp. NY05-11A]MDX2675720.1 hypothetical protein [Streptomyces sp. NY05-11A]